MDWDEQEVMGVDDGVHTAEGPYCGNPGCWCHTDVTYHDLVEHPVYLEGELEEAYGFFEIYQ